MHSVSCKFKEDDKEDIHELLQNPEAGLLWTVWHVTVSSKFLRWNNLLPCKICLSSNTIVIIQLTCLNCILVSYASVKGVAAMSALVCGLLLGGSWTVLHLACLSSTSLPIFRLTMIRHCQYDSGWRRREPPTVSFPTALQRPVWDVTKTSSMFDTVYGCSLKSWSRLVLAVGSCMQADLLLCACVCGLTLLGQCCWLMSSHPALRDWPAR